MNKLYLSSKTRERAKKALDDLSTEQLLAAVRKSPVPDYRLKEVDESYQDDVQSHKTMFESRTEQPSKSRFVPRDPVKALNAMKYAEAPSSPGMGDTGGPRKAQTSTPVMEGDPLGPMRAERPKLEKQKPVYENFRLNGDFSDPSDEGGGSSNAVT